MAGNPERRDALTDAGLRVLGREGARGLTHRSIDREAGVPIGTASNYFRTRDDLLGALGERIIVRLQPDPAVVADLSAREPSRDLFTLYMRDILRRTLGNGELMLALFELRLEAARRPQLHDLLRGTMERNFQDSLRFQAASGLPGGETEIELMHYVMDGLILDRLTVSIGAETDPDEVIGRIVERVIPG